MMLLGSGHVLRRRRASSLIELLVVIAILGVLTGLTPAAVQRARAAADRTKCQNNLHQLGLAFQNFHSSQGHLPPGHESRAQANQHPYLSWRGWLLPYLEHEVLWRQTEDAYATMDRSSFPWAAPAHPGVATVVPIFLCPSDSRITRALLTPPNAPPGSERGPFALSSYLGVLGRDFRNPGGTLFVDSQVQIQEIGDGASNTLLVGERPPSFDFASGWWYAAYGWTGAGRGVGDAVLGVEEWVVRFVGDVCPFDTRSSFGPSRFDDPCGMFHFWSPHLGSGAHFLFADGAVRFLPYSAVSVMPALASRAGGETVELTF